MIYVLDACAILALIKNEDGAVTARIQSLHSQNRDRMGETEDAEMPVEGKNVIQVVGVDQGETGAIGKAQAGSVILGEDRDCGVFDRFRHP